MTNGYAQGPISVSNGHQRAAFILDVLIKWSTSQVLSGLHLGYVPMLNHNSKIFQVLSGCRSGLVTRSWLNLDKGGCLKGVRSAPQKRPSPKPAGLTTVPTTERTSASDWTLHAVHRAPETYMRMCVCIGIGTGRYCLCTCVSIMHESLHEYVCL